MNFPLSFHKVQFSYNNQSIFRNLSLDIKSNQFISIIGINGSGKSTFLKLAMGLLRSNSGEIQLFGNNPSHFSNKNKIGSTLQDIDFPPGIQVIEVLKFVSKQYQRPNDIEKLIEDFELSTFTNKFCSSLSGGMRRRLALACAFLGNPQVIFLDEPATGLDSSSRKKLLQNLRTYKEETGALILMINHHPQEVVSFVDQFFHIKGGLVEQISPEIIKKRTLYRKIQFICEAPLPKLKDVCSIKNNGTNYQIISSAGDKTLRELMEHKVPFQQLQMHPLSGEEFLQEAF